MFRSKVLSSHLQKGHGDTFQSMDYYIAEGSRQRHNFLRKLEYHRCGIIIKFKMFVLNSENRVKNNDRIYTLNWKLGNS